MCTQRDVSSGTHFECKSLSIYQCKHCVQYMTCSNMYNVLLFPTPSQSFHKYNAIRNNYTKVTYVLELRNYYSATINETLCEVIFAGLS